MKEIKFREREREGLRKSRKEREKYIEGKEIDNGETR